MTTISLSRTAHHSELGNLILLHGLSRSIDDLVHGGLLRAVQHDGHRYIVRSELEAYTASDIEALIDLDAVVEIHDSTVADRLLETVHDQADIDARLPYWRRQLVQRVHAALQQEGAISPFAHALEWPAIWMSVAHIAVNTAGDDDAARIAQAFLELTAASADGKIGEKAFTQFHRTLVSLAALELDDHFDEIWRPGYGLLAVPTDGGSRTLVLAVLRRLVALFSGYRGNPEGSETPSKVMGDYLALVQSRSQG